MTRDLFGNALPDAFSMSLPVSRPKMPDATKRENRARVMVSPRVAPETPYVPIGAMSRVDLLRSGLVVKTKDAAWADGARGTFRKSASAPGGKSAPGRDAMLGHGEPCRPVQGLAHIWASDYREGKSA